MAVLSVALAYILAGAFFLARDFMQPAYNRPGYIRDRQFGMMAVLVLLWFPWTIRMFVGYWQNRGWWGIKRDLVTEAIRLTTKLCSKITRRGMHPSVAPQSGHR